jgi:hypothetical protein
MFVGGQTSKHCDRAKRNAIDRGNEAKTKKSTSAVDALDVFATLAHLFVNFGGNIPEFLNHRAVWFRSQVGTVPASLTSPSRDVIEPAKDYWLDMAASATELEKMLIKHADGHHNSPDFVAADTT